LNRDLETAVLLHHKRLRSLGISALLISGVTIWLACRIPQGILTYPDELLTAERSREMLLLGRGTVHLNFQPSFAKPPLQYWLTTLSLPLIRNSSTAVRIWPLVYGIFTAVAVGWLAFLIEPKRPWFIPLAVAIYVSCPLFLTEASRALLDTGLTFFTVVAIACAQLARRKPVWWIGVAFACWLGTLQKIPLVVLVWAIIVVVRLCQRGDRDTLRNRWFARSALLAIAIVATWPVFQHLRYGMPLERAFVADEPSQLFGQRNLGGRPYLEVLDGLLLSGWAIGTLAVASAVALLFGWHNNSRAREISVVALAVTALAILFNFRAVRYVLPVIPCFSLALAFCLDRLLQRVNRRAVFAFVLLLPTAGFLQAAIKMHHGPRDVSAEKRVAEVLGSRQRENLTTIVIRPPRGKHDFQIAAFYLFYGDLKFPVKRVTVERLAELAPARPLIGVCPLREFDRVRELYPDAQIVFTADYACCWQTSPGPLATSQDRQLQCHSFQLAGRSY
jgi:4-amino-4-deoxy-L-arabinose transferase-like glycosyltransferase